MALVFVVSDMGLVAWARSPRDDLPNGWPDCPLGCSNRGTCSHIGVCSCQRGWSGEACDVPQCAGRCSGHGHCLASDFAAACVCDEGYFGYDCAAVQPPSPLPLPPAAIAAPAPPLVASLQASAPPLSLQLNITSRAALSRVRGLSLSPTLPLGASALYWVLDGAPPRALRIDTSGSLVVHASAHLAEKDSASRARPTPRGALNILQAEPSEREQEAAPRRVVAAAVDWMAAYAYVATNAAASSPSAEATAGSGAAEATAGSGAAGASIITQLALPSLATIESLSLAPANGMTRVTSMALGGHASETVAAPSWLHVLRASASGTSAELLVLSVPEMKPAHAMRFGVPSPIDAAQYDARSGWLYLLCTKHARLLRVQMRGGQPAAAPGLGDTLTLPEWEGALPVLLPFSRARQLVFLSAARPAADEGGSGAATPLRICRVRTDAPPPLSESAGSGCAQLRGQYALEQVLTAVADEHSGSVYLGCRSGRTLRLTVAPLRVAEALPLSSAPLIASAFRPSDGALWMGSDAGELVQLSTRATDTGLIINASDAAPGAAAWFRWGLPSLTAMPSRLLPSLPALGVSIAPSIAFGTPKRPAALSPAPPLPPLPSRPPPPRLPSRPPPPEPEPEGGLEAGASTSPGRAIFWVHHKLGYGPAVVLALLGACLGSMLGGRLYRLCRLMWAPRPRRAAREPEGLKELP